MSAIPQRAFYSVADAAELTGMSTAFIYEAVAKGRRRTPPEGAILPDQTRMFGGALRIHRSWVFGEPQNLSTLRPKTLTPEQIEDAMGAALVRFAQEFIQGFAEKRKAS